MWILIVEACAALFLLVFIVWWTMFSGREPKRHKPGARAPREENDTPGS